MKQKNVQFPALTNNNLWETDFARSERLAFIAAQPVPVKPHHARIALGIPASQAWMNDVSGTDRRSVKAQLAGRGDYRATWWNVCSFVLQRFYKAHSLEWAMYRFHQFHGELTLFRLEVMNEFRMLGQLICRHGVRQGVTAYCLTPDTGNDFHHGA